MVKVSIIIPIYNAQKYIETCLNSITSQTFKDYEIILIDDGSTDNTLKTLENYTLHQKQFKLIVTNHSGPATARNIGLGVANGKYIKFIDADDTLYNQHSLQKMVDVAEKYNVDVVFGKYYTYTKILGIKFNLKDRFNTSGLSSEGIYNVQENKEVPFTEMPSIGNKLFTKQLFENLSFPDGYKWEDLALVPALLVKSNRFYFLNQPIYSYNLRFNNTTVKDIFFANDIFQFFDIINFLENNLGDQADEYAEELKKCYATHGALKYLLSSLWIDIPKAEKISILQNYINLMELTYPTYKDNEFYKQYTSSLFLTILKMHTKRLIKDFKRESDIDKLKEKINKQKIKLNK